MAWPPVLYAAATAFWALFLGMIAASYRGGTPVRRQWIAAFLVSPWLIFCVIPLWKEPAFEPLWLQYLLLVALPAGLGFAAPRRTVLSNASSTEEGTK